MIRAIGTFAVGTAFGALASTYGSSIPTKNDSGSAFTAHCQQPSLPPTKNPLSGGRSEKRKSYLSWDEYFMGIAFLSAERSKDPDTQVGACIINKDKRIIGTGYNGFPNNVSDDILPWGKGEENPLQNKTLYVCHAEMNAIINSPYPSVKGGKMYVTLAPCNECSKMIIQSGIEEVVYYDDKYDHRHEFKAGSNLLKLAHIPLKKYKEANAAEKKLTLTVGDEKKKYSL